MQEVTGPIIAVALVLCAVFVPTAFISGITGQFYKQFALTIAVSTVISAFNSLTLSPALCALLLPEHGAPKDRFTRILDALLGWFFSGFNRVFKRAGDTYSGTVRRILRASTVALVVYAGLVAMGVLAFIKVPAGFIPAQDMGYYIVVVQLPDASSSQVTIEKLLPFNLTKELSEDDNTAVGVLMGSVMIGLAIIIAASIAS